MAMSEQFFDCFYLSCLDRSHGFQTQEATPLIASFSKGFAI